VIGTTVADDRPDTGPRPTPSGAPADGLSYRPALDGIRAIAVLAVIAYHDNYAWARGGFLGVDMFFVLSGFLITTLLVLEYRRRTLVRLAAFWTRRARRLLPALLLVLCFVAVYIHFEVLPWEREGVRNDALASLFYVANWRFIFDGQGYFQLFAAASPLRHMWSLAIEEQYYLVWPLVVFACLRIGRGSVRVLATVSALGVIASVFLMRARFVPGDPTRAYYATDARAHELLIGALLALALLTWRTRGVLLALVAVPAVILVFGFFYNSNGTSARYYEGGSLVFAFVAAAVIAGAMQPGVVSSALSFRPLVWIGQISYGLYLWHWPIDVWLVPSRVSLGQDALNGLRLLVTFAAAIASYVVIERPVRTRSLRPRTALLAFVPAMAVVAGALWVSAAGATPPPSYLWGLGDPLVCGEPRPSETAEAVTAAQTQARLELPPTARAERVLLLGDSTACSLWPGLRAVGEREGIATDQGSVFGCGIATGEVTSTRNEAVGPNTARCPDLQAQTLPAALARARPTVVVWMSIWEKSDLVVDGRTIVATTPEWDTTIMRLMDEALDRITAGGARVVIVTEASPAPNPAQSTETFDRAADDAGYGRLNDLLRRFATRHPMNVQLVDLAAKVCPGGAPCPSQVEGLEARPDGHHFTPTAAAWAANFLFSQMFGRAS
jgi:peptidoglycan/LPS O-acetylase OafA/YrhL